MVMRSYYPLIERLLCHFEFSLGPPKIILPVIYLHADLVSWHEVNALNLPQERFGASDKPVFIRG